jgi:transcriptional/translational regulatory protein YebC/TACO1
MYCPSSINSHYLRLTTNTTSLSDYGPDPDTNPRLKTALAEAKRQGFPKDSIEAAIRRGQGLSTTGKPLESVTVEAVFPPGIAAVIECLTESKLRTLADVRHVISKAGGQVSPTQYLFDRKGRVTFRASEGVSVDAVMEYALEIKGFEDIEEIDSDEHSEGIEGTEAVQLSIITEPNATKAVSDAIVAEFGLEVETLEIEWQAKDDMCIGGEEAELLEQAVEKLREIGSVQNVWLNAADGEDAETIVR